MWNGLFHKLIELSLQLLILGIAGGAVSWYYSKIQKRKELQLQLVREFAQLHGKMLALRFEYNSFHVHKQSQLSRHPKLSEEAVMSEKWKHYQKACELLGVFYGMKPLLIQFFPKAMEPIEMIHAKYQDWRRRIGADRPVLQELSGKNEEGYEALKISYREAIAIMHNKI